MSPLGAAGFVEPMSRCHPKYTERNLGEFLGCRIPRLTANSAGTERLLLEQGVPSGAAARLRARCLWKPLPWVLVGGTS